MLKSWYLVQTKGGQEAVAELNLQRQAYVTFLPRNHRTVRHARQVRLVTQAHFPGYLFVSLDEGRDRWRSINNTRGVVRLVTGKDRPLRVPTGVVEMLQARCDAKGVIDLSEGLSVGDKVRVIRGPLTDQTGLIVPSKAYGILAAGRPIIAVTHKDGEIARLVRRHACGLQVDPGDGEAFARAVSRLARDQELMARLCTAARASATGPLARAHALASWREVLETAGLDGPLR
jgi:transcription elongation factor/antiterminator RfaH